MLKKILHQCRIKIILFTLISLLSNFLYVYAGLRLADVLDRVVSQSFQAVVISIVVLLLIWTLAMVMNYFTETYQASCIAAMNTVLKDELLALITDNYSYAESIHHSSGEFLSWLTNDVNQIDDDVFTNVLDTISGFWALLISSLALLFIHWSVFGVALLLLILMLIVPKALQKKLGEKTVLFSKSQEDFSQKTSDVLNGIVDFFNNNLLFNLSRQIKTASIKSEKLRFRFKQYSAFTGLIIFVLSIVSQISLICLTALLASRQLIALGMVLAVGNVSGTFFNGASSMVRSIIEYNANKRIFSKYDEAFDPMNAEIQRRQTEEFPNDFARIVFQAVSFGYEAHPIVEDFNCTIAAGDKVAIIGPSGKGKSTLVKMLFGAITGYSGEIMIDQTNLNEISRVSIHRHIGMVEQNVIVLNDTLKNNITLYDDQIDEARIAWALAQTKLTSLVASLPDKLETIITDGGKNLSGGEKQRIAIARALVREKQILIVDEGTSALDHDTALSIERLLLENNALTVLFITHHLSAEIKPLLTRTIAL